MRIRSGTDYVHDSANDLVSQMLLVGSDLAGLHAFASATSDKVNALADRSAAFEQRMTEVQDGFAAEVGNVRLEVLPRDLSAVALLTHPGHGCKSSLHLRNSTQTLARSALARPLFARTGQCVQAQLGNAQR